MIDPGEGSAWVDCYAFGSDSYVRIRTNDQERMRIAHNGNAWFAGKVGIGTPPSYPLHIVKSDLVGIHIVHEATSINRALVVTRRNAANNATLEWYQEFDAGDSPSWNLTRVNRPTGRGRGFLMALCIGWNGDIYSR